MPSWDVGRAGVGLGAAPAIVPCLPGSRRISPFSDVAQSWSDWVEDGVVNGKRFVVWRDLTQAFKCYGNADPSLSYTGEQGETVLPHVGSWPEATYPGPSAPIFANPLSAIWLDEFFPVGTPFNSLTGSDFEPASGPTNTTGGGLRSFLSWPPMRRVLRHPDPVQRDIGFDYLVQWNRVFHAKRPFYHQSKNGLQAGGPQPFVGVQVGGYEINKSQVDELGRDRKWNWSSDWSVNDAKGKWNAWDKGHNNGVPLAMLAFTGHALGFVNQWNQFSAYWQNFRPNHVPSNGNGFDQPRSAYWQCVMAINSYLCGFEWADPDMIRDWVGGLISQNGGKGWKPSEVMDWVARRILGQQHGGTYETLPDFVYYSQGSDDNVLMTLCLDCSTNGTESAPGVHGCKRVDKDCNGDSIPEHRNNKQWVDSAGTNWGDQIRGVQIWQGCMAIYGLAMLLRFHDFIVSLWGPTKGPLAQSTYDNSKAFLADLVQQIDDRAVNDNGRATFYCGCRSTDPASYEPAGYPQSVAEEIWADIPFRAPNKKQSEYEVRQVRNRTDEWNVAQDTKDFGDEFYSLITPAFARVLGPLHPRVSDWLDNHMPAPGTEGSDSAATDYSPHARYSDEVYRLRELASGIIVGPPRSGYGARASLPNVSNGFGGVAAAPSGYGARASVPTVNNGTGSTPRAGHGLRASVPDVSNGDPSISPPAAGMMLRASVPAVINQWNGTVSPPAAGLSFRAHLDPAAFVLIVIVRPPTAGFALGASTPNVVNGVPPIEVPPAGVGLAASVPRWLGNGNARPPRCGYGSRASAPTVDNGVAPIVVGRAGFNVGARAERVVTSLPGEVMALLEPGGPRRKIAAFIRARLLNPTRARERVYLARRAPIQGELPAGELPAVVLWPEGDDGETSLEAPREYKRTFRIHAIAIVARHHAKAGRAIAGDSIGQHESDDVDALLLEIESKLLSDPTLGGLADDTNYVDTMFDQADGATTFASGRVTFEVTYFSRVVERAVREAADFLRAYVDYSMPADPFPVPQVWHAKAGSSMAGDPLGVVVPVSEPPPAAVASDAIELRGQ